MARVWAEINTAQWYRNYQALAEKVAPAEVVPVVKSDGYGLGAVQAAAAFRKAGAERVAVATVEEAEQLAGNGLDIQFLGVPEPEEIPVVVENDWIGSVADRYTAELFSRAAVVANRQVRVHVLIDSGMGRLGFLLANVVEEVRYVASLPGLCVEGLYSHFPAAERVDDFADKQMAEVRKVVADIRRSLDLDLRYCHMANSYAASVIADSYDAPFNMIRPGIELHGAAEKGVVSVLGIEPVLTLKARLVAVRRLPAGYTIGYGRSCRLSDDSLVGTLAVGYADGYPRSLSNKGEVLVHGKRCPIAGSVCMDYIQVILDSVPRAKQGDEAVLIGRQGDEEIPVEEFAEKAGTITYEILTRLGHRVKRFYYGDER